MAKTKKNKIVLYSLLPFGNGFTVPANIINGGSVWENLGEPGDMILVGEMSGELFGKGKELPEGVIKVITKKTKINHFDNIAEKTLKAYKKSLYVKHTDPHFYQAIREKLEGDDKKWKAYTKRVKVLKAVNQIPELGAKIIEFDDILND